MKLIIKDLGPIRNNTQAIDLSKDFLVFVGHNNSGKTYVSQLLWTIYNDEILNKFAQEYSEEFDLDVQDGEWEITEALLTQILEQYTSFLHNEILNIFNIDQQSKIISNILIKIDYDVERFKSSGIRVAMGLRGEDDEEITYCEITKIPDSLKLTIVTQKISQDVLRKIPKNLHQAMTSDNIKFFITRTVIKVILSEKNNTFLLPASRHIYPIFYRYIYDIERREREKIATELFKIIDSRNNRKKIQSDFMDKLKTLRRPYTEPINQLFEKIYFLSYEMSVQESYLSILQKLQNLMGGEINLASAEGIAPIEFSFMLNDNKTNLPMYLASSSVSQLTLLYLYFKYWVEEENNFLIIDEPEENLDPENQMKLLEILIEFATKNNNKVLFTTHSPLLADAVNNCIYLDVLQNEMDFTVEKIEKIIEENNLQYLNPSVSLSKDNIGVYFFTGKKIIDYQADEYGVIFRNFRDVQNNLDKSARILTDYIYLGDEAEDDE